MHPTDRSVQAEDVWERIEQTADVGEIYVNQQTHQALSELPRGAVERFETEDGRCVYINTETHRTSEFIFVCR